MPDMKSLDVNEAFRILKPLLITRNRQKPFVLCAMFHQTYACERWGSAGMSKKMNSQAVGLDIGLSFIKWLTGAENLHYGIWTDLEVTAGNLGQAQSVYTEKLFSYLPSGSLRILDVGGGAGETARKLIALGHQVDIVVPSPFLAERCRANAPKATVHPSCRSRPADCPQVPGAYPRRSAPDPVPDPSRPRSRK